MTTASPPAPELRLPAADPALELARLIVFFLAALQRAILDLVWRLAELPHWFDAADPILAAALSNPLHSPHHAPTDSPT